jgi:hypothetical protein
MRRRRLFSRSEGLFSIRSKILKYRLYRAYAARNDDPGVRTFQYVSLVLFFGVLGVWILVEPCLGNTAAQAAARATHRPWFWVLLIGSVLLVTFFGFRGPRFIAMNSGLRGTLR